VTYRYRGDGRFLVGVPARDLTSDEVARLPERLRRRLVPSGLYVNVKPAKEVKPNV
jgi:hypothetical protein